VKRGCRRRIEERLGGGLLEANVTIDLEQQHFERHLMGTG
jgi:hypothetical protein